MRCSFQPQAIDNDRAANAGRLFVLVGCAKVRAADMPCATLSDTMAWRMPLT